jgi:hypothetical protein
MTRSAGTAGRSWPPPESGDGEPDHGLFVRKEIFFRRDAQSIGSMSSAAPTIDQLLGEIASLPLEDQVLLHEVIGRRLADARRQEIADEAAAAQSALERGDVRRGTTADLFAELDSDD